MVHGHVTLSHLQNVRGQSVSLESKIGSVFMTKSSAGSVRLHCTHGTLAVYDVQNIAECILIGQKQKLNGSSRVLGGSRLRINWTKAEAPEYEKRLKAKSFRVRKKKEALELQGIEPCTSRMQSERSTI